MGVDIHELIQELEWYQKNQIPDIQPEYLDDIITVLKAQESMRPGLGIIYHDDGSKDYFLHCPFDGVTLVEGDNYCRRCGRAVKWK